MARRVMWGSSLAETSKAAGGRTRCAMCSMRGVREALPSRRWRWPLRRPVVDRATASNPGRGRPRDGE
jgi:hypothetical protein